MNRQPWAVGSRVVRVPVYVTFLVAALLLTILPSVASANSPTNRPGGRNVDLPRPGVPWSPDSVELAHTAPEAVLAGTTEEFCTGWRSTFVPPDTIRVLRTRGPLKGTVEVVPFVNYVPQVMPSEWPAYYPLESLKAGAVQVKNYGWYFTIVYRGGKDATGACYDVKDTAADQNYNPEKYKIYAIHKKAVKATWQITLRRFNVTKQKSEFLLAEYRTGSKKVCGQDIDGKRLYQRSILRCGHKAMTYEQILRLYLEPRLEIVTAGAHDIIGDARGDGAAMVRDGDTKSPRLFSPTDPDTELAPADIGGPSLSADALLGARSIDMDRNGWDDLLYLQTTVKGWELDVARSDGATYGQSEKWASANAAVPEGTLLLAGDFDADSYSDAALLVPGMDTTTEPPTPIATLRVFRNTINAFAAPVDWWTGPLDLVTSKVYAAESNGDGRTDLIVVRDLGEAGLEYDVAGSLLRGGGLMPLAAWYTAPDLRWDTTRHVVGDYDRDGRDDVWVVTPNGADTIVSVLKATKQLVFLMTPRWASDAEDGIPFEAVRLGSADVNNDGLGDLVLFIDRGVDGTRLVTLRTGYVTMVLGSTLDDATLDWSKSTPY